MDHGNGHGAHGHGHGNGHGNGIGHETTDTGPKLIIYSAIGLAFGTFIICLIVWGIFNFMKYQEGETRPQPSPLEVPSTLPPEPRLQVEGAAQIHDLRAKEDHVLSTYAWVDQKSGVVRVPIEKAMDMLAQKGLPSRDYMKNAPAEKPAAKPRGPAQASLGASSVKQ
jgi:hypothetical protein